MMLWALLMAMSSPPARWSTCEMWRADPDGSLVCFDDGQRYRVGEWRYDGRREYRDRNGYWSRGQADVARDSH